MDEAIKTEQGKTEAEKGVENNGGGGSGDDFINEKEKVLMEQSDRMTPEQIVDTGVMTKTPFDLHLQIDKEFGNRVKNFLDANFSIIRCSNVYTYSKGDINILILELRHRATHQVYLCRIIRCVGGSTIEEQTGDYLQDMAVERDQVCRLQLLSVEHSVTIVCAKKYLYMCTKFKSCCLLGSAQIR